MSADVSSDFIISILDEKTNSLRAQQGFGQVPLSRKLELSLLLLSFWHSLLLCCQFERRFDDTGRQALYSALGQLIVHSGANEAVNKILVLPKEGK